MEKSKNISIVFLQCNVWGDPTEQSDIKNDAMAQELFDELVFHGKASRNVARVIADDLQILSPGQPSKTVPAMVAIFDGGWVSAEALYNKLLNSVKGTRLHHNVAFGAILNRSDDKKQELGSHIVAPSWSFGNV